MKIELNRRNHGKLEKFIIMNTKNTVICKLCLVDSEVDYHTQYVYQTFHSQR